MTITRLLASLLLLGTVLLGIGAALHPVLSGDAASDLTLIAGMGAWRQVHLTMLAGSGLVVAGIWVRALESSGESASGALVGSLVVISIGAALNALNIAYMAGSGTHLAAMYRDGHGESAAIFAATHPIGLMSARFGNFLVALGALALGAVERASASRPAWLAWLAWLAAAGGFVGVIFFDEASRLALAAVSLLSLWQVATAIRALRADRQIGRRTNG